MNTYDDRSERGFNLIEVVIALALLAAVLLTISGLFIQGSQSVNTGRDLTEATSLATDILEQMDKWAFSQLYTNFAKTSGDVAFTVSSISPPPAAAPTPVLFNATLQGMCQTKINQRLPNASAWVTVSPLGTTAPDHFDTAKGIRVKVTVYWTLKLKPRSVSLETVRF